MQDWRNLTTAELIRELQRELDAAVFNREPVTLSPLQTSALIDRLDELDRDFDDDAPW